MNGGGGATFPYVGNAVITGSLIVEDPLNLGYPFIDTTVGVLDGVGFGSVDWASGYLKDGNGTIRVDWDALGTLYDSLGVQKVNWETGMLSDQTNLDSIDWENRKLTDANGDVALNWYDNTNIQIGGNPTITGSLIITQNLTVLGSSSITYLTASQLAVSASYISVNVFEPAQRFGGLYVYDSGSSNATASLTWDSTNNKWIYSNASGSTYTGGGLISGPRNTGSLGQETFPTQNRIVKGQGEDHITDSNITDTGTLVSINSNTQITGSLLVTTSITASTFSGSYTGSLFGTSSWTTNAISASYAVSASAAYVSGVIGGATMPILTAVNNSYNTSGYQVVGQLNGITANTVTKLITATSSWATNALTASTADSFTVRSDLSATNGLFGGSGGSGYVNIGFYGGAQDVYRTTNASATTNMRFSYNSSFTVAGTGGPLIEADRFGWVTNNDASRKILRASVGITNLVNTAGSESADLVFSTKPGSPVNTAVTERIRITSTGTTIVTGSLIVSSSAATSFTLTGNQLLIPSQSGGSVALTISGSNTKGGTGYLDFLQVTNTSASITTPTKYFRLDTAGNLQVLRSDYNLNILQLTDAGNLYIYGATAAVTSNSDGVSGSLMFNNNNSQIYDDSNFHIHSRTNGNAMWINTNNAQLNLLAQSPVLGGNSGSGVAIGSGTLTGFVTINNSKNYTTAASYGYLVNSGTPSGQYPGGSQTVNVSLYAVGRIWGQEIDAFSDERMKDIQSEISLEDGLKLVKTLKPIQYTWKEGGDKGLKVGYSAQQVSKAGFDHLISLVPKEGLEETIDNDGFLSPKDTQFSMNYDQVIPYHGVVIKHLLEKIEQLEEKIKQLENK
jgi:hypothetical protein